MISSDLYVSVNVVKKYLNIDKNDKIHNQDLYITSKKIKSHIITCERFGLYRDKINLKGEQVRSYQIGNFRLYKKGDKIVFIENVSSIARVTPEYRKELHNIRRAMGLSNRGNSLTKTIAT